MCENYETQFYGIYVYVVCSLDFHKHYIKNNFNCKRFKMEMFMEIASFPSITALIAK